MNKSRIIRTAITRADLIAIAERQFGDMVKAIVHDVVRGLVGEA